ncbi:integral membrane protein 2C-like [Carcharodon carcharias]|uniref:integral membrane protein 2C-like n=1 Tax=Carcharodon carcharias TaxID=13397 RepID=UPI001B7E9282|nr:integral membrane protein 2C-like [Carcharodon carcharias]
MVKISLPAALGQKPEKTESEADKTEILIPQDDVDTVPARARKSTISGFWCLTLGLVILLSGLILGAVYVYKHYFVARHPQENMFHCRVLYDEDSAYAPFRAGMQLEEDVRIYLEDEVELINVPVPQFRGGDAADIIHDFQQRLTAYHDISLDKCYVIELNTTIVMPPRNLWELLANVKKGTYLPQTYVIQEEMEVTEQISNMQQLGTFIHRLCSGKETYKLKHRNVKRAIEKRDIKNCQRIRHFVNVFVVETSICEKD